METIRPDLTVADLAAANLDTEKIQPVAAYIGFRVYGLGFELRDCPAGFINIVETIRPDLTVADLAAANPDNVNTTTTFVRCGFNVKIPCIPGSPACTGGLPASHRSCWYGHGG